MRYPLPEKKRLHWRNTSFECEARLVFGIWFDPPGGGSRYFVPLKFVCLCVEGESTQVELACYKYLMVIDMFFILFPAGNKDGSLPSSQR